jgi:hypothetical protein
MHRPSRHGQVFSRAVQPGRWGEGRLIWLLVALVGLMIAYPFFVHRPEVISVFNLFQTAVLFLVVFAVCRKKSEFIPLAAVFSLFAGLSWLDILHLKDPTLNVAVVAVLSRVSRYRRITLDEIAGAISAYILIGLFFTMLFLWIELLQPGSFEIRAQVNPNKLVDYSDFVLFSFATLTTLGYGDITPLTHLAQVLSVLESMIGVLFVAVLVGGLVGMLISEHLAKKHQQDEASGTGSRDAKDDPPR